MMFAASPRFASVRVYNPRNVTRNLSKQIRLADPKPGKSLGLQEEKAELDFTKTEAEVLALPADRKLAIARKVLSRAVRERDFSHQEYLANVPLAERKSTQSSYKLFQFVEKVAASLPSDTSEATQAKVELLKDLVQSIDSAGEVTSPLKALIKALNPAAQLMEDWFALGKMSYPIPFGPETFTLRGAAVKQAEDLLKGSESKTADYVI